MQSEKNTKHNDASDVSGSAPVDLCASPPHTASSTSSCDLFSLLNTPLAYHKDASDAVVQIDLLFLVANHMAPCNCSVDCHLEVTYRTWAQLEQDATQTEGSLHRVALTVRGAYIAEHPETNPHLVMIS